MYNKNFHKNIKLYLEKIQLLSSVLTAKNIILPYGFVSQDATEKDYTI